MAKKSAIVTGGGQGIGKAIVGVLLKHGYRVAILDIDETVGKKTAEEFTSHFGSGSCVFYRCDVTDSQQIRDCYDQVTVNLGNPSVVVNNAGTVNEINWKKMIDLNLTAVIDLTYLAVERMTKDKGGNGGTIINVASEVALISPPGFVAYSGSKSGVVGFTQSVVASLALADQDWGISLLTLCPGLVSTALSDPWKNKEQIIINPSLPQGECQQQLKQLIDRPKLSAEEVGVGFEKLLTENKNGAVLRVLKNGENIKYLYLKQNWSEV